MWSGYIVQITILGPKLTHDNRTNFGPVIHKYHITYMYIYSEYVTYNSHENYRKTSSISRTLVGN